MVDLDGVSANELRDALERADGKTQTKRLLAAIAFKNGVTQTELAEWYGVQRRTIYGWLGRIETASQEGTPLERAVRDDSRSGRPRKLTDTQRATLHESLRDSPGEYGYDAPAWSPELVRSHLDEKFDVSYSLPSCRRLMKEAGLCYRRPRPGELDPEHSDTDRDRMWWLPER